MLGTYYIVTRRWLRRQRTLLRETFLVRVEGEGEERFLKLGGLRSADSSCLSAVIQAGTDAHSMVYRRKVKPDLALNTHHRQLFPDSATQGERRIYSSQTPDYHFHSLSLSLTLY